MNPLMPNQSPVSSAQWTARIAAGSGILCTLLGLIVLTGWYAHDLALLHIHAGWVAMAYNTALGFVLCGASLLGVMSRRPQIAALGVFYGLAIGLLTLGEYILHVNFGIDQLFMRSYTSASTASPGRMAFNAALCYFLMCVVFTMRLMPRRTARPLVTGIIGAVVVGLATVGLSGYLVGVQNYYAWGAFTRMAVHTCAGLFVLGVGVVALAWQDDGGDKTPRWLPVLAGIGVAVATICLWQAMIVVQQTQMHLAMRLERLNPNVHITQFTQTQAVVPTITLVCGMCLAVLLCWMLLLAQTARSRTDALRQAHDVLEQRVAERTEDLAAANQALMETAGWQRLFLRDVLASVTEGKLLLCEGVGDLPKPLPIHAAGPITLTRQHGLTDLRSGVKRAADVVTLPLERLHDFVTAVNEAGMNAIVHADGGTARVYLDPQPQQGHGAIQVWVQDDGAGITVENLPRAALVRGFTTAGTLGHGLKMMLQTADRTWLLTGADGTTVVVEQDCAPPMPSWMKI